MTRRSRGRRQGRRVVLAVVAVLVLAGGAWLLFGGSRSIKLTVDGRSVTLGRHGHTVKGALRAARLAPRDGVLYSAGSHRRIDPHAAPALVFVDGHLARMGSRVGAGDHVRLLNGPDAVEPVDHRRVEVPAAGLPDVENRIWISKNPGFDEVDQGRRSGEIVGRRTVAPAGQAIPETGKVVALTFDDGPNPQWTPQVLQILHDEGIKATFCLVGYLAQRYPDLVKAEVAAGHTLCDHSMNHVLHLDTKPHTEVVDQVNRGADVIRSIIGADPLFYRPPGGFLSPDVINTARQRGLRVLKWSVDPSDYTKPPAPAILARVLAKVGPGAVVLLHDGGGDRSHTVAILKQLIDALKAKGFSFVIA
jgi:peptidoglycan/xylan/chitin deacetylase (PgdA/CDA1 family)